MNGDGNVIQGKNPTLKAFAQDILHAIRNNSGTSLPQLLEIMQRYDGNESQKLYQELMSFIETYMNRINFSVEEMEERIAKHCKVFAKHNVHELRARAKLLMANHYKQTYNNIPECLKEIHEIEIIAQKHLGSNSMVLCEALFEKGGVYYYLGDWNASTDAIVQSQSVRAFANASHEFKYKSHVNLSRNYIFLEDPQNARIHLQFAEQSWEIYQGISDKGAMYMRKSDMLRYEHDWQGALDLLKEGLAFYQQHDHPLRIAEFHKEIGEFYNREDNPLRDFSLAMNAFEEALQLSKKLDIARLEAAIIMSMWKTCKNFEQWKLCAEYLIEYNDLVEKIHMAEVEVYVKKLENKVLEEKQQLMREGKPAFSKVILDEVVQLREEQESLKKKYADLHSILAEIEHALNNRASSRTANGALYNQLHELVSKRNMAIPTLESYLTECATTYPTFSKNIRTIIPSITAMELKVAKLIKLNLSTQSIATMCGVTLKSIENHRMNLRKKARLTTQQSLSAFISSL